MSNSNRLSQADTTTLGVLDKVTVLYLAAPLALFLLGWIRWWAAVPLIACTVLALRPLIATPPGAVRVPRVTRLQVTIALLAGGAWTLLGGADHIEFANADWHLRDAVLHDLVVGSWPVGYGLLDGAESLLRAPLAFYLPAALIGKVLGLGAAHIAMGLWTATGATLFLLQVVSLAPSRWEVASVMVLLVIFFSGLDIVGNLLNDGPLFRADWNITTHLEWWAGKFQYSSMTTQLFWVPNHALGGWLAVGLMARHARSAQLDSLLPLIVVAVVLWSPLTALGLVPLMVWRVAVVSLRTRSARLLHPLVWLPAACVGAVIAAYLTLDPGGIAKGWAGPKNSDFASDLLQQAQFFLLEAGLIGAATFAVRRSADTLVALVVLALLPMVYLGPSNDLVMRASIPSLAVLAIAGALALTSVATDAEGARKRRVLAAVWLVGAVTPIAEIARAVLLPAWPINMTATLIAADCGRFAPHYVARLGGQTIGLLLRHTHRLALGPLGPAECRNPAADLMWNWSFTPRPEMQAPHPVLSQPNRR